MEALLTVALPNTPHISLLPLLSSFLTQNYWTDVLATTTPLTSGERRPNGLLRLESALELHADDMVDLPGVRKSDV
jgi:hypothetical protein